MTPTIAFVVATLDEERHIEACLRSLLSQDYPADQIEIAVVDGGSTDTTRRLVEAIAASDSRVKLYDNPRRIAAAAFNIGIRETTSEVISLVSAHSITSPDYARVLVEAFDSSGAALVGGRMVAEEGDASPSAEAIRRATSSPFGLGNASFHFSEEPGWVDTAFPGAYRRSLLELLGGFDESLARNQDDELHLRARRSGHRMWYEPRLRTCYRSRTSVRDLWQQYFGYGVSRAATFRKHRRFGAPRHAVPPLFVAALVLPPALVRIRLVRLAWSAELLAYGGVLLAGTLREAASPRVRIHTAMAMFTMHFSYGAGFWVGLLKGDVDD